MSTITSLFFFLKFLSGYTLTHGMLYCPIWSIPYCIDTVSVTILTLGMLSHATPILDMLSHIVANCVPTL